MEKPGCLRYPAGMNEAALGELFRRHGVRFAYLWGSRARGEARPDSDYDFAVSMKLRGTTLEPYLKLCADLSIALGTEDVDVTLIEDADVLVRYVVQRDGRLLYERDKKGRIAFECRARKAGWDEGPRWESHDRAMVRRLMEGSFGR